MTRVVRGPGTRHPFTEVRLMVSGWLAVPEHTRPGWFPAEQVARDVNTTLNGAYDWRDEPTDRQVRRALALLAGRGGPLRRVPRGQYGPDGERCERTLYYTREGWAAAAARGDSRRAADESRREAWETVHDALAATGVVPLSERGEPVVLSLHGWCRVTGLDSAAAAVVPPGR